MSDNIKIFQLNEIPYGAAIFRIPDDIPREHLPDPTKPHRHDHYMCFFVENGSMNFHLDFKNIDIRASSLLLSCPGQVHQVGHPSALRGWMLAFEARFIDEHARSIIEQSFAKIALLQLDDAQKYWFSNIFQSIASVIDEQKPGSFHQQLIHTLINALFYKAVSIFQVQEDERVQEYSTRSIEIAKTFRQLVKSHFHTHKKPADYASKMNMTVSYLNDTVKSVTGFPSTWFIHQEIFQEAQRQLFYTGKSVKEIAFGLGYEDYRYFIRLFTKTVGTSPASFRKQL